MDVYDYIVFVAIISLSVFIGIYHGYKRRINRFISHLLCLKRKDNAAINTNLTSDFQTAKQSMSALPIAASLLATFFNATSLLAFPAEIYTYGSEYWISTFGVMTTAIMGAFIFGPFFSNLKVVSVFQYMRLRFGSDQVQLLGTSLYLIRMLLLNAIFIYAPSATLSIFVNLRAEFSILVIGLVGTVYSCIGGLRGVIWADFFQVSMMFIGLVAIIVKGVYDIGGFANVWDISYDNGRLKVFNFNPDPFIRQSSWSLFFGTLVYYTTAYCFDQSMIVRFIAAKDTKTAKLAILLNVPGVFILMTLSCFTGLVIFANYAKCDPMIDKNIASKQLVAHYVISKLGMYPGIAGLFLASVFSAALSSVSSCISCMAVLIWEDYFQKFDYFRRFNDSTSLRTSKILVAACGLCATAMAFLINSLNGDLVQISFSINGALSSPIVGLFVLGAFFSCTNVIGAFVGTICGFIAALWVSIGAYIVKPVFPFLSSSIESCVNTTNSSQLLQLSKVETSGFNKVFHLSYMWYCTFGVLVAVICGLVASLVTGGWKQRVDKRFLVFDCCFRNNGSNKKSHKLITLQK